MNVKGENEFSNPILIFSILVFVLSQLALYKQKRKNGEYEQLSEFEKN